jgi:hypothetical protein
MRPSSTSSWRLPQNRVVFQELRRKSNTHLTQNEQNEGARDFEKPIDSKSTAIFY